MTDSGLPADIADMITMIEGLDETPSGSAPVRFIVATDWSDAAAPLAVLKAYRAICGMNASTQLVFAVPHQPAAEDAACVQVLLEGAGSEGQLQGIELLSFDEAASQPYDSAFVPTGDPTLVISEAVGIVTRMHDVKRKLDDAGRPGRAGSDLNIGSATALRTRLAAFSSPM